MNWVAAEKKRAVIMQATRITRIGPPRTLKSVFFHPYRTFKTDFRVGFFWLGKSAKLRWLFSFIVRLNPVSAHVYRVSAHANSATALRGRFRNFSTAK